MKRIFLGAVLAVLAWCCPALAVDSVHIQAQTVTACGTQSLAAGVFVPVFQDLTGTICGPGSGGSGVVAKPYGFTPSTGAEQHNLGVATATVLTVPADALFARICVSGNNVRWTASGTAPTATVGQPQLIGQCDFFSGHAYLAALQFIQTAATATLDVVYSK